MLTIRQLKDAGEKPHLRIQNDRKDIMKDEYFSSIHWAITLGTNSGYDLAGQKEPSLDDVVSAYQILADETESETGVYISAVAQPSRTIYKKDWGCPEGGEYTITFTGSCNPFFSKQEPYLKALHVLAEKLKEHFQQATLLLEVTPVHIEYFRENG